MITATYGIAWAYVLSDVALTGYKEHKAGAAPKDVAISVAHAAIFQSLASMIIPMYTIHTIVHQAEIAFLRLAPCVLLKHYLIRVLGGEGS
jgi:fission process protein 1